MQTAPEIKTIEKQESAEEPFYRVIIHNDDVTPMDFVVHILVQVFLLHPTDAARVMLTAHYQGAAYVQTLPRSEAQRRIGKAHFAARLESYPLHFSMEPE
jgi:ATP-dependent Clp protease adaptor protein ClpS